MYPGQNKFYRFKKNNSKKDINIQNNIKLDIQELLK
jgi:hypothetical protein